MAGKTALVFGGTGLVGSQVIQQLERDERYEKIKVFSRRELELTESKVQVIVVNFDALADSASHFEGDEVYCCLGTTMKKAGSEAAFKKVDFGYPVEIGRLAKAANIEKYLIITAMGADTKSFFFYNRVKGEVEKALQEMNFPQLSILRPGLLLGGRQEARWGESMAQVVMSAFSPILPGSYRPITGETVARAMIHLANEAKESSITASGELLQLGKA